MFLNGYYFNHSWTSSGFMVSSSSYSENKANNSSEILVFETNSNWFVFSQNS